MVPRLQSRARRLPADWAYSGRIELVVWSIPILVIMFLAGVIWVGSHELDPCRPLARTRKPLEVQVVSLDWKWLFIYPEQGVATVNQLVVPAGVPVHFSITSASVMNTFFVPQLGSMIYAMHGMVTQLNLQADQPGDFYGESAQFSGDGFSDMNFEVRACPRTLRAVGRERRARAGPVLDRAGYDALAQQSTNVRADHLPRRRPGAVPARSRRRRSPPGPGPQAGRGGRAFVRTRRTDMFGKLSWNGDSLGSADPADRARSSCSSILGVLVWVDREGLAALSVARVDHQRRPQAHRRHVHACSAW